MCGTGTFYLPYSRNKPFRLDRKSLYNTDYLEDILNLRIDGIVWPIF